MTRKKKRTRWMAPVSDESETTSTTPKLAPGQLTLNFWEKEVGKSRTALRRGIPNVPSKEVMARAKLLAEHVLQPVRDWCGVPYAPGSWYRGEQLERVIAASGFRGWALKRGKDQSQESWDEYFARKSHPKGEAADIEIPTVSNRDLFEWIRDNCEFDQLILEGGPDGWIHVSYREGNNRKDVFELPNA
jgi:hypothetical protein